ncbi:RAB6A-GEF complex partner protein 1 [Lingula anatina]|uniref:Protein RIC1 homolog n=1 Tax=Lingula anatina TaxID=7574 RepID=A0A1S3JAU3_LINAN|nr:RAB6A-GEF complex partner protein 1 [Lingula anatina]|eukprot:XP_013407525.1 RAB6A-GEF complex partner protein 1 [Lingula anatina]
MYFPVGWPKYLSIPQDHPLPPIYIVSNRDRSLFAILTGNSLCIWFCKPCVEILSFRRSENSVSEFGENRTAEWRPDSSMIAITTSKGYILFYKVEEDENVGNHQSIYVQKDGRRSLPPRKATGDLLNGEGIPALKVSQLSYIQIQGGVTCLLCVRDDLLLSTYTGYIQRIRWDGCSNGQMSVNVKTVPFSTDLQFSRASTVQEENVNIPHMEYSPLLGGFATVLSNGRAAFLTVTSAKFEPHQIQGVWAQEVNNASCVGVNHKYRLMAFGLKNGEGMVYSIDEITGALQVSHRLAVSSKDYPDASHVVGSMTHIKWTPDGCALAAAWENGGFAVWSVFGALLFCSLGGDYGLSEDSFKHHSLHIKSMEWGAEGYHLWVMASRCDTSQVNGELPSDTNCNGEIKEENQDILQLQFVKSSLTVNPCMSNHQHLFLQGEDRLYVNNGLERTIHQTSPKQQLHPSQPGYPSNQAPSFLMGSKQWQVITVPSNYLGSNWPIRYAAIDRAGQCVAVAGKYGLAHYALFNRKWKLFGNETQEKDMVVSGGLTWWRDFVCVACYNILGQRDEIRLYPRSSKLDNVFATVTKVPSQVLLLNTFRDILIVLCADSHIMMFSIDRKNTQPNPTVEINKIQEVAIGGFIPHPASVTAITLTSLRTETASVRSKQPAVEAESILLNVAGRLLMFQRDRSLHVAVKDGSKQRQLPFTSPVMVASAVENVWSTPRLNSEKKHLVEALWLGCGAHGMKVWLPLFPRDDVSAHGFMSKRIMLPFRVDIYPLAVLFEDAVILGATNDATCYDTGPSDNLPFLTLERTSQIYLHHILRQLLRRNLGHHALEIAHCCTELPYFPHCLELLLHEVLEEEATSKDPIPDPLLPRVVAFIQEFPEFLQTIAHCARKTEIALWHYLFNTVGNPREMFEECMLSGKLKTAASYLIILQNLEKPIVSRQHATMLLDTALDHNEWELARDLVRFLKAIDPSDADTAPDLPPLTRANSMGFQGVLHRTPPMSPDSESNEFVFVTNPLRGRGSGKTDQVDGGKGKEKSKSRAESAALRRRSASGSGHEGSPDSFFIDVLLARHARKLLTSYRLKDVGCFAANMEGYQLVTWLKKERLRAAKVEDFVTALKQLHQDFQWPLPILTNSEFLQLSKDLSASSSSQGLLELEEGAKNMSVKDSGYLSSSTPVISPAATPDSPMAGSYVLLQPKLHIQSSRDDTSLAATEMSDDFGESTSMDQSYCLEAAELELLCHELANKGPAQAELQLRYLLHIMIEAGCLEWSLLISILLRDVMAVVRTVNTASFTDTQIEIVGRMREGLSYLEMWADTECMGYKPFFSAIRGQIQTLQKIVEQNPPNSRLSTPRSRSSSVEKDTPRPGDGSHDNMNNKLVEEEDEEEEERLVEELAKEQEQNSGYDCRIS